jgi:hypothetical protein
MLSYAENLAHNAHLVKNKWEESDKIVTKAANQILTRDFLHKEIKSWHKAKSAIIQQVPTLY